MFDITHFITSYSYCRQIVNYDFYTTCTIDDRLHIWGNVIRRTS